MPESIQQLRTLHELPWGELEGTHITINHSTHDHPPHPGEPTSRSTTEREGDIVGRSDGEGLYYDSKHHETVATRIGPAIYLQTTEDTILEVMTDNPENELLDYQP